MTSATKNSSVNFQRLICPWMIWSKNPLRSIFKLTGETCPVATQTWQLKYDFLSGRNRILLPPVLSVPQTSYFPILAETDGNGISCGETLTIKPRSEVVNLISQLLAMKNIVSIIRCRKALNMAQQGGRLSHAARHRAHAEPTAVTKTLTTLRNQTERKHFCYVSLCSASLVYKT